MKINFNTNSFASAKQPTFKGVFGDVERKKDYPNSGREITISTHHYYPFINESKKEIEEAKSNTTYINETEISKCVLHKPIDITQEEYDIYKEMIRFTPKKQLEIYSEMARKHPDMSFIGMKTYNKVSDAINASKSVN